MSRLEGLHAPEHSYPGGGQAVTLGHVGPWRRDVVGAWPWPISGVLLSWLRIRSRMTLRKRSTRTTHRMSSSLPKSFARRLWEVDRALYGFRRLPRLWGRFRDPRLRKANIPFEGGFVYLAMRVHGQWGN